MVYLEVDGCSFLFPVCACGDMGPLRTLRDAYYPQNGDQFP